MAHPMGTVWPGAHAPYRARCVHVGAYNMGGWVGWAHAYGAGTCCLLPLRYPLPGYQVYPTPWAHTHAEQGATIT